MTTNKARPKITSDTTDQIRSFQKSLPMALLKAREAVMVRFRKHLQHHDVTEQQWRVLRALNHTGKLSASQLSERTFISMPSLSRIIKGLQKHQLVTRTTGKPDRRSIVVDLTSQGRRLIRIASPESEAIYRQITEQFGEARLNELYHLLGELNDCLKPEEEY